MSNNNSNYSIGRLLYLLIAIGTAIIGYNIHGNIFYSIANFIFWPISWLVWLINHDVNLTIIKSAFDFFLK